MILSPKSIIFPPKIHINFSIKTSLIVVPRCPNARIALDLGDLRANHCTLQRTAKFIGFNTQFLVLNTNFITF